MADYLEPMASMGYLARINFRAFSRALEARILPHGVTSGQWRFLRVLWEEDGISQRTLSQRVGAKEATTVRSVQSLITAGLVKRRVDAEDRRKWRIFLTAKGRNLQAILMPFVREVNDIATSGISERDLRTTRRVLARMAENLRVELERS